jgi:excisionase family DNA binding protein
VTVTSNELLTIQQAAQRMGMSARHVRRLVAERRIAHHRFGRSVRLTTTDVDAYIAAMRVEPITEADVWGDLHRVR